MKKTLTKQEGFNTVPEAIFIEEFYLSYLHLGKDKKCMMFGYIQDKKTKELINCALLCWYDTLQEILEKGGNQTEKLSELVSNSISKKLKKDIMLGVEKIIGDLLYIDNMVFGVDLCERRDGDPDHDAFFIREVFSKNDEAHMHELHTCKMGLNLLHLNSRYENYLQLLSKGVNESVVKKEANLKDDFLFELAYLSHRIKNFTEV